MLRSNANAAAAAHHPSPLLPYASSWSNLSPLAPPFTVDRPLTPTSPPRHDSVYPWPPIPVAHESSDWSTAVATSSSFRSLPGSRAAEAAPYYPCYPMLEPVEGVPWNGPFDGSAASVEPAAVGGISSWMDPSVVFAGPSFQKGTAAEGFVENEDSWGPWHGKVVGSTGRKYHFGSERSDWLDDQHPAIHEEKVRAPCNISGMSVLGADDLYKGNYYFRSKDPTSIIEEPNDYLNLCYDSYITQVASCAMDAVVYYPDTYSSVQARAPSATRANLSMDCWSTNTCPTIPNANHYKIKDDDAGYILGKRKEYSINQNDESKEGYIGRRIASSERKTNIGNFMESSLTTKELLLDSELTTGNSTDSPTKLKAGLRHPHMNILNPFPNEDSVNPDDLSQTSPETLDQLNHAIDSPCWKGIPLFRQQYPLNVVEEMDPYSLVKELEVYPSSLVKEPKGSDDLVQNQKYAVRALNTPEQDGNSIHISSSNSSYLSPLRGFSLVGSLPGLEKKSKDANEELSNYAKGENALRGLYSHVLGGQCIEALSYPKQDAKPKECGAKPLGHQGTFISADQSILGGETNLDTGLEDVTPKNSSNYGYCSAPQNDSQVLVKAMLCLSEILLTIYSADSDELKEHDQEVVQLVVDNLKALILKSKEGASKHTLSEQVTGHSQATASKADIAMKCANNKSIQVSGKMQHTEPCMCSDKPDISLPKGTVKDFGSFSSMAKVLDKGLKESLHEQEDNPQILLYKNLWIQAEIALCSLKHDCLKLELENHKNQTAAKPHVSSLASKKITQVSGSLDSMPVLDGYDVSRYKSQKHPWYNSSMVGDVVKNSCQKPEEANTNKASEVETSVMARFRALKVRDEKLSSTSVEDQGKLAVHSFQPESETNIGPKLHPAKLSVGFTEGNLKLGYQKPEAANSSKPSDVGTSVMARLRALKVRDEKLSSISIEDLRKLAVDSSQPEIENNIGPKLNPVKLDDLFFMEGNPKSGYQKPEEANSIKACEVDTSVMARFRALKIRDEKLSSTCIDDQRKLAADSSQLERENNIGPKLHPAKLTHLGFMEGNLNPYRGAELRDGNILAELKSDSQHLDANTNEGNGLPSINSEHAVTRLSQFWTASGQPDQSYLSNGKGKHVFSGGYGSPSFEWEQVELFVDSSQPERENNIGPKLHPAKMADLGFMEGNPQSFCEAAPREGNILVKPRSDSQLHGADNEENVLPSINSEHAANRLSQIWTDNGLPYQSYLSNEKGKYFSAGYDSSSSEWEHVFKEDFTWYNSHEES